MTYIRKPSDLDTRNTGPLPTEGIRADDEILSIDTVRRVMPIPEIARVCHEVNRAYCASQGDYSQEPWEKAPEWQRQSAIQGVEFAIKNPDSTPSDSHQSWLEQKKAEGWKYGPVKDPARKEHPCFLPYGSLPPMQKAKDWIFLAVVRSLTTRS